MLPGRDGFDLLEVVRRTSDAAVIMLTARDAHGRPGAGVSAPGADDYLVKPFAMAELVARMHGGAAPQPARRRRRSRIGELELDEDLRPGHLGGSARARAHRDRAPACSPTWSAHREQVVSKTQILTAVWGYDGFADNLVEVNVSTLRRKLEAAGPARVRAHRPRARLPAVGDRA